MTCIPVLAGGAAWVLALLGGMIVTTIGSPVTDDGSMTGIRATKWLSAVAAKTVDEAAVAFVGAFAGGGCSPGHWTQEFALLGGFAAGFFTGFGFEVERLRDGGRTALLAES